MTPDERLADLRAQWSAADGADESERGERMAAVRADIARHLTGPAAMANDKIAAAVQAAMATTLLAMPDDEARPIIEAADEGAPANICADWNFAPPARQWLIPDWLPAGRIALLAGPGGGGKSRLAIQLADGIAGGEPNWLPGGPTLAADAIRGCAIMATWEDDRNEARRRLGDNPAIRDNTSGDNPAGAILAKRLADRFHALDYAGRGALWSPDPSRSGHTSTEGILTPAGRGLRAYCERHAARLLIIDPLAAAFTCNENDRGLVRGFMADWDGWARRTGCAVLIIAHPPKDRSLAYSGSTDWHAAARAVWTLDEANLPNGADAAAKQATRLCCIKSSYGPRPADLRLDNWRWWRASAWPPEPTPEADERTGQRKRKAGAALATADGRHWQRPTGARP